MAAYARFEQPTIAILNQVSQCDNRNYGETHSRTLKTREMTVEITVKYIQKHLKYVN